MSNKFFPFIYDGVLLLMFCWIQVHITEEKNFGSNQPSLEMVTKLEGIASRESTETPNKTVLKSTLSTKCSSWCSWNEHEVNIVVNCSSTSLLRFPIDCPKNVHTFLFDNTRFYPSPIDPDDVKDINYPKLVNLYMTSIQKKRSFPLPGIFFHNLTKLEVIDLSQSRFIPSPDLKWPPSLRKLKVNYCSLDVLPGIAALQKLEELHANGNNLKALPKINRNASITYIELRDNPLDSVDVSILAPLCSLAYLGIRVSKEGTLNKPERFCHCARLKKWIKMASLRGEETLICNSGNRTRHEESCEEELIFSADILNDYNQCLNNEPATSLWELLLFALFFSVLFPIFYFAYETYNKYNLPREQHRSIAITGRRYSESTMEELEEEYESNYESGQHINHENEENKSYESLYM